MELNLAFIGFGSVARAFARMLEKRQNSLANEYGLRWKTTAIATGNHGCITSAAGIDLVEAVECVERGKAVSELRDSVSLAEPIAVIERCSADILFETTPLNADDG